MNKIDLMSYINKNWRIVLNEDFKQELKTKIKERKLRIKEISKLTGNSLDSIWQFHQNKTNATLNYLLTLCKRLKVNEEKLYKNIIAVYTGVKKAAFYTKYLTVDKEFALWWGAWIGEGDHSSTHEAISLTNYEVNLLKLHIEALKRFGFPHTKISTEIITNHQENKDLTKHRWSKILSLSKDQIASVTYMERATQEGARVQIWSSGLFRVLHAIDNEVKAIIKNSPIDIKIAYIRGIFAAEGSVRRNQIRIGMKDLEEIRFIKKTLFDIGVFCKEPKPNICNGAYELSITSYNNIKKFIEIDGFKAHIKRKKRLNRFFKHYENKLPYYERFRRLKQTLSAKGTITNKEFAKKYNTPYKNAHLILKTFVKEGKLVVDRSEKELKYSLA